jgi:ketosteroid isomerase-like protein
MSESRAATVRRLFERFNRDGVESALDLIADDFVAEVPPSLSAEPDVYEGHDGVRRYFAAFEGLTDVRFELLDVVEESDAVITWLRLTGRGSASGIEVEQYSAAVNWVVDGKVVRIEPHPDMDAARKALGA